VRSGLPPSTIPIVSEEVVIRPHRLLVAGAIAATAALTPAAHAGPPAPDVPPRLQPGEGHKVYLVAHATGVQIYACNPDTGWGLVAPRASLYDDSGKLIVTHYGGPTWEARDASKVVGARVDGVIVDPTAIPWLLLAATPVEPEDGGRLSATTYIQRVNTTGGLAPARSSCTTAGDRAEVAYTADYVFWKRTGQLS
jgi:hypothetical protein